VKHRRHLAPVAPGCVLYAACFGFVGVDADGGSEHVEVLTPNTDLVRRWMPPARTFQGPFVKAWNEQQEIYRWVSAASQATRNARYVYRWTRMALMSC
jgi:hypothetical protein